MLPENYTVSVIIPAYNEERGLAEILPKIRAVGPDFEIIVISDGSTDDTAGVARNCGAKVIEHPYNIGNGAAVKTGIRAAKGDIVLMIDADQQHPPENIPLLLDKMDKYKMAVGSRTSKSKVSRVRTIGNTVMRYFAMYLTDTYIADLTSGFRAVHRDVLLEFVHLFPNKYSYPTTLTMSLLKEGYPVAWIPMDNIGRRTSGNSGIRPLRDGVRFLNIMVRIVMLFNPQKVFLPIGFFFLILGLGVSVYTIKVDILQPSAVMLVLIGVFTMLFGLIAEQLAVIRRELNRR